MEDASYSHDAVDGAAPEYLRWMSGPKAAPTLTSTRPPFSRRVSDARPFAVTLTFSALTSSNLVLRRKKWPYDAQMVAPRVNFDLLLSLGRSWRGRTEARGSRLVRFTGLFMPDGS